MAGGTQNNSQILGSLQSSVETLKENFEAELARRMKYDEMASKSRERLFEAQERMNLELRTVVIQVARIDDDVRAIKNSTDATRAMGLKAEGAGLLGKYLMKVGGWLIAAAVSLYQFWDWFKLR